MDLSQIKSSTSVVIPVKNESATLEAVLEACSQYCSELIVVDGHSTDGSLELAKKGGAKCLLDTRKGKGEALRCVIPHISKDVVVFIDADGSHIPADIPKLVWPIICGDYDHVTASRLIGGSSELHGGFDEFLRLTGSSFITACINKKFNVRLSDSQNGFRAIRCEVLKKLDLKEDITTIEQEMIMQTLKKGFRMGEVPSHEHQRQGGESKVRLSRVWHRYGWCLIKGLFF